MKRGLLLALVGVLALGLVAGSRGARAEDAAPPETPEQRDARMKWWREAKFGLFIHWGVYSVPAGTYKGRQIGSIGEWIMRNAQIPVSEYRAFAGQFNPTKYDPEAWAALAKEAGMRYVVITSKHHDGFGMFDSKVTDWDAVDATPAHRDLIAPLANAVRKNGLKFGLYYSQAQDWTHPGGAKAGFEDGQGWDPAHKGSFDAYLKRIAYPQVREILTQYRPDVLWWDTPYLMTPERARPLHDLLALRPGIITNNRLGGGFQGDSETPEQFIPATGFANRDWEVCMTMNDTWGYKSYDHNWKSTEDLIRKLCDIASKGGNFLLNVGPTSEGEIPPESVERLKAVGKWMKVNSEAIYGTTASKFPRLTWGRSTTKTRGDKTSLYLLVFDWPKDGRLELPGLRTKVRSARVLGGARATVETANDQTVIRVPSEAPDPIASVVRVDLEGPAVVEKPVLRQSADGSVNLAAMDATLNNPAGAETQVETKEGVPNIGYWLDARATASWTFRLDKPGSFDVMVDAAGQDAISRFTIEAAGEKLSGDVPGTGSYTAFKKFRLGRLTLRSPGEVTLTLRPAADGWKPINVRSLSLNPAP
jgi:alpha-L-fucosidase